MPPPEPPLLTREAAPRPEGEITRYLSRLRNGDRGALNPLLEHTYKRFRDLAQRTLRGFPVLRGELETDDLLNKGVLALQQILLAAVDRAPASSTHLFRFAARKMRHQLIDLVRRVGLQPRANAGLDRVPGAPAADPTALLRRSEIHAAITRLSPRLRVVVELHVYQGLTHSEVSLELGKSEKTVGRDWLKAVRLLTGYLGGGDR
jgi:RNA polymerase sigma factor (sigma-70 family)